MRRIALYGLQQLDEKPAVPHLIDALAKADGSMAEYDHVPGLREQLTREPRPLPKLVIADKPFDELTYDDFTLEGYDPHGPIKFKVAV